MKRKICVITGTRADYGILTPVLRAIEASRTLKLQLVVTGMHLMPEFGRTINEIKKDGFRVAAALNISYNEDSSYAMAVSFGRAVSLFAGCFKRLRPDLVFVLGDRGEMLAAAIAASYLDIPVAHAHGGELSGHIDGQLRHAITKLAHFHFPATRTAKERICQMGEEPWRVVVTGAPALDTILKEKLPTRAELAGRYGFRADQPLLVIAQHPVLSQAAEAGQQLKTTLKAVRAAGLQTILIYPNADAGGRRMIKVIKNYRPPFYFRSFQNLPHKDYLGLLKTAALLVGNSSSGIIEAPSFHLPVVNIGDRQAGRERGSNVIDVPHNEQAIARAIKRSLSDRNYLAKIRKSANPYGDGQASGRIVSTLAALAYDRRLLEKRMTY